MGRRGELRAATITRRVVFPAAHAHGRRLAAPVDEQAGVRILPALEWDSQGSDRIKAYWQVDAYAQTDLTRWLPHKPSKFRLNAQLRVNNLSNFSFPKYVHDPTGTGLQPYGDWRGRTYSLSLTASY